jgi:hypothetical protein
VTAPREQLVARFATVLADLHTIDSGVARLCEAGRRMLDADGAAMTVVSSQQSKVVVAATDELARQLEDLQDVVGEGPSQDAYRDNAVQVADFSAQGDGRWSLMHEHGRRLGFEGSLIAVPLRPHRDAIGTFTAHRVGRRFEVVPDLADFLTVAVGAALLHESTDRTRADVDAEAWSSRAVVHQATGMIISQVGVRAEDALALLRGQAFVHGASLLEVAQQIVDRHINFRNFTIEGD